MDTRKSLLDEIAAFLRASGMTRTAFGRATLNDGKLLKRLEGGQTIGLRNVDRIRAFIGKTRTGRLTQKMPRAA